MPKTARNVLIVLIITVCTHTLAVMHLPQDFDEPVYIQAATDLADELRQGDIDALVNYSEVREHPALAKIIYAAVLSLRGEPHNYTDALRTSRIVSAVFGVAATLLIAVLDPLAGGLMAVQTLVVKYSSQAYLEAVPLALGILAVFAFLRTRHEEGRKWFWLSAIALGAATAAKFTYTPVLVVVLAYLAFFEKQISWKQITLFGVVAIASFFALNISLWHDPFQRVAEALSFHIGYQQGPHVTEVNFPWYQPFIWLFVESPGNWHPSVFFYDIDQFIAIFAFAGIGREWNERRWLVVWLVAGLAFLLLWGTKWPQYVLTVVPAICIMAAETLRRLYKWFTGLSYYNTI